MTREPWEPLDASSSVDESGDLKSAALIHLKGWLFLLIALACGALIVMIGDWAVIVLAALCVWASCRFYYYCFYVIEKYVDSSYRFSGLLSFARYLLRRRR